MLNVITKYKKESHDGMKRAACNEREKGWHLSAPCAFCHQHTPQTGQMEFGDPTRPTWRLKEITDEVFKYFYK